MSKKNQNIRKKLVKYTAMIVTLIIVLTWVKFNNPYSISSIEIMFNELISLCQRNTLGKENIELSNQTVLETKKLSEQKTNQLSETMKDLTNKTKQTLLEMKNLSEKKPTQKSETIKELELNKIEQFIQCVLENKPLCALISLSIVSIVFLITFYSNK